MTHVAARLFPLGSVDRFGGYSPRALLELGVGRPGSRVPSRVGPVLRGVGGNGGGLRPLGPGCFPGPPGGDERPC